MTGMEASTARHPEPGKRPAHHAPPPADSTALHAVCKQAAAHHQNNLLPRIRAGTGTVTEATHNKTLNLLSCKLRPKMAREDTLWIYHGESRTARLADLRTIIPRHVPRTVRAFTIHAVPNPITAECTHCNPRCAQPLRGRPAAAPAHPNLQGGHILRHYTQGPTTLPPARGGPPPRHTTPPCRTLGSGAIPLPEASPPCAVRRTPAR